MAAAPHVPRTADITTLLDTLSGAHCAAVIGLSNMGKSTLLRALSQPDVAKRLQDDIGRRASLIYVDCNRMLDLTDQGLYEVILRAIRESVSDFNPDLTAHLEEAYNGVVRPESAFDVPLNFNNAMTAILEQGERDVVLLLDEFDEAFAALDGRVFLNLRALRDKYPRNLLYVTANVRRLGTFRTTADTSEFIELSEGHTYTLKPFDPDATRHLIAAIAESTGEKLSDEETDFLIAESGGHPGLVVATALALVRMPTRGGTPAELRAALDADENANAECARLWRQLLFEEQETCVALVGANANDPAEETLRALRAWGIVTGQPPTYVGALFERFIRRQTLQSQDIPGGLVIDSDAGDVWVDGRQVPPLTDLEYRLLICLHERLDKVTDKYQIVEAVWGTDYIDQVDDARIEKLVSRLRAKFEPDPANPRFLITVRGRGYRLGTSNDAAAS